MLNSEESISDLKREINNAIEEGKIRIERDTAYFRDGRVAGGISTESKENTINSILHCLQHGGFDGNVHF